MCSSLDKCTTPATDDLSCDTLTEDMASKIVVSAIFASVVIILKNFCAHSKIRRSSTVDKNT